MINILSDIRDQIPLSSDMVILISHAEVVTLLRPTSIIRYMLISVGGCHSIRKGGK